MGLAVGVAALCGGAARADGPAASNGWNWMASFAKDSPACAGYGSRLYCYWRALNDTLIRSVYSNGSFPAPTSLDGVLTSGASVGGAHNSTADGTPFHQTVAVRGTDHAVWLREMNSGVPTHWYSLGGIIHGRPSCSSVSLSSLICAVRGMDDGLWVNGRGTDQKFFGWGRVDNKDGTPRLNVRSSPQVISRAGAGMLWAIVYLGDVAGTGKRDLWVSMDYSLGATRTTWTKLGVVHAAHDSDINCPSDGYSGVWGCAVRTLDNDVNHISIAWGNITDVGPQDRVISQRIIPKPNNFPVVGTPTIAYFRTTRNYTAIGIQTVQNHFWLRAD